MTIFNLMIGIAVIVIILVGLSIAWCSYWLWYDKENNINPFEIRKRRRKNK